MRAFIAALLLTLIAACSHTPPAPGSQSDITALAARIRAMSPTVDPTEATRAATIAYEATFSLAQAYQITDAPLIHNSKVNAGRRPRGLCYHWAEDIEARLNLEQFETLDMARAIANADKPLLIEHSTAVITPKGAAMEDGVVLDPWREGGTLFWKGVREDTRYDWVPRLDVLIAKGQVTYAQRSEGSVAALPAN